MTKSVSWVAVAHGCNKDVTRVVDIVNSNPFTWVAQKYKCNGIFNRSTLNPGKKFENLLYNTDHLEADLPFYLEYMDGPNGNPSGDRQFITFDLDENHAKDVGLCHSGCGVYLTLVEKKNDSIQDVANLIVAV